MRYLDPRVCLKLYLELGSLSLVSKALQKVKIINHHTGRPFTRQAIHLALLRNPEYKRQKTVLDNQMKKSVVALRKSMKKGYISE